MATLFEREEEGGGSSESHGSVVVNTGHGEDVDSNQWENVSACSSKGVPLSKEEIYNIFGGLNPLDIFGQEDDSDDGHDFLYKGRSIRRVRRIKVNAKLD